jgi:TfoX/Sxy family transcriptional regulator of competence genes
MQVPKSTEADNELFRSLVPDGDAVVVKPMFGNLGAFVNGNMFAGLFGAQLGVKVLHEASRAELAAVDGTGPFGPQERPMGGYVALPSHWQEAPELVSTWIARALSEVGQLPPKSPKSPKKSAPEKKSS